MTEKWEDTWFRKLKPNEKLLYLYICDKCDIAGFWPIDFELASYFTGISTRAMQGAYKGLARAYIEHDEYLWLRDFVRQQRNWPLSEANKAHAAILSRFEEHPEFGIDFQEELKIRPLQGACKPPCIGKGIVKVKVKVDNYSEEFEVFWIAFKGRWDEEKSVHRKGGKVEAWTEYQLLTADEKKTVLAAAPLTGGKTTKDACRWLKYKRFTDDEFQHATTKTHPVAQAAKCENCGAIHHVDLDRETGKMLCPECRAKRYEV